MDILEAIHEVRVVLANHALTVRCGMMATRIIGPYLLRDTMNAERYLEMLENYVWPKVAVWENIDDLIFVQDGVPPHFTLTIHVRLDQHFPGRWLGRRGTHEWPPRSPYLTPIIFIYGVTQRRKYTRQNLDIGRFGGKNSRDCQRYMLSTISLTMSDRNSSFHTCSFEETG